MYLYKYIYVFVMMVIIFVSITIMNGLSSVIIVLIFLIKPFLKYSTIKIYQYTLNQWYVLILMNNVLVTILVKYFAYMD